jgi:hypothetical protein
VTTYKNKCDILGQLWQDYRDETDFEDFVQYNDLGLPLAYLISQEIVKSSPQAEIYVNETFELFLMALEADMDEEYESLEDLLVRYGS